MPNHGQQKMATLLSHNNNNTITALETSGAVFLHEDKEDKYVFELCNYHGPADRHA